MAQNVTFADAYYRLLTKDDSRTSRLKDEQSGFITSKDEIVAAINKTILLLEEQDKTLAMKEIKALLKKIPPTHYQILTTWNDTNGLDILHHSIIQNCPEMVSLLIVDNNLFEPEFIPKCTPYAHLAAYLGHANCLRPILQHRPNDYFKITKLSQIIKLPQEVKRKFKIREQFRSTGAKTRVLERVKSMAQTAEIIKQSARQQYPESADVTGMLADEMETLEKHDKKQKTTARKVASLVHSIRGPATTETKQSFPAPVSFQRRLSVSSRSSGPHSDGQLEVRKVTPKKDEMADRVQDIVRRAQRPQQKLRTDNHVITVYWDVFSAEPEGVVRGAGQNVTLNFASNANDLRPNVTLNRKEYLKGISKEEDQIQKCGKTPWALVATTSSVAQPGSPIRAISKQSLPSVRSNIMLERRTTMDVMKRQTIEIGVRSKKKYKSFQLKVEPHVQTQLDESHVSMNKTPLSLAADRDHLECVNVILDMIYVKNNPQLVSTEPLTLATKARCPEAIVLLLGKKYTRWDYQGAVLQSIRQMYPDCLSALLDQRGKDRQGLFDGTNLFHILYTQSLMANYRYEMMTLMTRVLIDCREDVNAHNVPRTFPMYTLINCAFNITVGKQIFYFAECLKMLLQAKANPHFNEENAEKAGQSSQTFSRNAYSSAISCVLQSAKTSVNFFESSYWSKLFLKKIVTTIETCDRTSGRTLNTILFEYMDAVCVLGLDRTIIRSLMRFGGNPDFKSETSRRYAVNAYFDSVLPYLTKFEVITYANYERELDGLMILCQGMTSRCLKEAEMIFLNEHLLNAPIQALPLCRYFALRINEMLRNPRSLLEQTAVFLWLFLKRNAKRVRMLPIQSHLISVILP